MQHEVAATNLADRQARLIIANAVDYGIVGLDLAGVITSWNTGAERIMGWTDEQAIGQSARRHCQSNEYWRSGREFRSAQPPF